MKPSANPNKLSFSKEDAENIRKSIEELMSIRTYLRKYSPDFLINDAVDIRKITKHIKKTAKFLSPIFSEFDINSELTNQITKTPLNLQIQSNSSSKQISDPSKIRPISSSIELSEKIGENFIFVSSNSIRKKLKSIGIEPIKIISSGGPMNVEDLRLINPNIPEAGLKGYQKKLDRTYQDLINAVSSKLELFLAIDDQDETDKMILKRRSEIEKKIGKSFVLILIQSWEQLS